MRTAMQRRNPSSAVTASSTTNGGKGGDGNGTSSSNNICGGDRISEMKPLTTTAQTTPSTTASSSSSSALTTPATSNELNFSNNVKSTFSLLKSRNRRSLVRYLTIMLSAAALVGIVKKLNRKSQTLKSGRNISTPSKTSTLSSSMALTYSAVGDVGGSTRNSHSHIRASFDLAYQQSFGFFDDIPNSSWILMQNRFKQSVNHLYPEDPMKEQWLPWRWYQDNWEPTFACQHERRIGGTGMGDGPKWVCNPHRISEMAEDRREQANKKKKKKDNDKHNSKCLIYSIGSNGDFQFEEGLHTLLGGIDNNAEELCEVHVFDPRDFSSDVPSDLDGFVHFHPWGVIGTADSAGGKSDNFKTLIETVDLLDHKGRTVDIFKIDCEGCEWNTYEDWFESQLDIRQILVEVHNVPDNANQFFEAIQDEGFVIFHKEPNTKYSGGMCQEYAFLKLHPDFFV